MRWRETNGKGLFEEGMVKSEKEMKEAVRKKIIKHAIKVHGEGRVFAESC